MNQNKQQIQKVGIMAAIKEYLDNRAAGKIHMTSVGLARAGDRAARVYRAGGRACSRCGDDTAGPSGGLNSNGVGSPKSIEVVSLLVSGG